MIKWAKGFFDKHDIAIIITVILALGVGLAYVGYIALTSVSTEFDGNKKITEMNLNDALWLIFFYCVMRGIFSKKEKANTTKVNVKLKDEDK